MSKPSTQKEGAANARVLAIAAAVAVVAILVGFLFTRHNRSKGPGFVERAQQAGIAFRMNNLPNEQGEERFRINLYDHGAGLAVGDYDNDGRDDIYFLNQHGPTALYRNRGDRTFEDVTAKAGGSPDGRGSGGANFPHPQNAGFENFFLPT